MLGAGAQAWSRRQPDGGLHAGAGTGPELPTSLYRFIWSATARQQIILCLVALIVVPVSMVPLELQRRMTNEAIGQQDVPLLLQLGAIYFTVMLAHGGLKYLLNIERGRVVELVALELRCRVQAASLAGDGTVLGHHRGALVSMVAAESEDVAGFVAESLSVPLLQGGTIVGVLAYLVWVQPLIAALAIILYLPELIIIPWRQQVINRLGRLHVRLLRALGDTIVAGLEPVPTPASRFPALARRAFTIRMATYRLKYLLTFLGNFLDAGGPLAVLVIGGWLVIRGQATLGTLVVFITAFQKVGDPIDQLMTYYRTAQNAGVKYGLLAFTIGELLARAGPGRPPS
jgi:ABC-type multidrug transport system fused ATPase/permease subunit